MKLFWPITISVLANSDATAKVSSTPPCRARTLDLRAFNVTDTGSSSGIGKYAAIIGGDHLRTQSYAQTVLGFYNVPAGSTVNDTNSFLASHADDPLVIVGNGKRDSVTGAPFFVHFPRRSDAALISNNGHISAFQNIDSAAATRMGTMYANNTIEAWGNVHAGQSVPFDDDGVSIVNDSAGTGVYIITLNIRNQDGTTHAFTTGKASITVSINQGLAGAPGLITVSELQTSGYGFTSTQPGFRVATWNASGTMLMNTFGFQFHVVAR